MNCKNVQENLSLYVGGDLDEARTNRLQTHLSSCAACGTAAEEYLRSYRLIQDFKPPAFGEELYDEIRKAVLSEIARTPAPSNRWSLLQFFSLALGPRPRWAAAAGLLLLVCMFGFLYIANREHTISEISSHDHSSKDANSKTSPNTALITAPTASKEKDSQPDTSGNGTNRRKSVGTRNRQAVRDLSYIAEQTAGGPPGVRSRAADLKTFNSSQTVSPVTGNNAAAVSSSIPPQTVARKPLRVEMQTNDQNIRIIWFSYENTKQESPGKSSKGA